tara:strand:- start:3429 stop:3986 length:558 start_codon:yes stop_codon:yes gene_type:complete
LAYKNDIFIIKSLKNGDRSTFEQLYSNYYQKLCTYLLNYTQDRTVIEDTVQDLFLSLWMKRNKINIRTSLNAFLYKAAYNGLVDKHRNLKIKNEMLSSYYHTAIVQSLEVDSDTSKKRMEMLDACLASLPERCREIFHSGKIKGMSYKEIAKEYDITIKTVEGHFSRAYRLLKECMEVNKQREKK